MSSLILRTATHYLLPILLLFSIFLLLRGHNEPGGGFVGGLVAAGALTLYALVYDVGSAKTVLRLEPHAVIGVGLLLALGSASFSLLLGRPFMTSQWVEFHLRGLGDVAIGTPVVFDIGVYLVVIGVTLLILLTLEEE